MTLDERIKLTHQEDYEKYIKGLAHVSERWVAHIREQFARKAVEMFKNETVRKLVLAFEDEYEKLQDDYARSFRWAANHYAVVEEDDNYNPSLETSCLNKAESYADAIWLLFGIELTSDKEDKNNG